MSTSLLVAIGAGIAVLTGIGVKYLPNEPINNV